MSDIDLEPKALLNSDDKYILQSSDIYNLLKYCWTGSLLPTNSTQFKSRNNLSDDGYNRLQDILSPLLTTYVSVQAHCFQFQNVDYPAIVSVASDILDYAENAGGDMDDSYYGIIFDDIMALADETDPGKIKELKEEVNALIDDCVGTIDTMSGSANDCVTKLKAFQTTTGNDQTDLKARKKAIHDKLEGEGGEITQLDKDIAEKKKKIAEDQKRYEHDVIVASTAPSYAWIGIIGAAAAATVMGIYGSDAVKMKNEIEELQKLLAADEQKEKEDKEIVANLSNVDVDLQSLIDQIDPALTTIGLLIGTFSAIRDDLTTIKDYLNTDIRKCKTAIAKIQKRKMIDKWNHLADEIRAYRQVAFVVVPNEMSLDEYHDQLQQAING